MRSSQRHIALPVLFIIMQLIALYLRADVIITTSGTILTGKIIQQTNNEILFAGADSVQTISRQNAAQVYKTFSPEDDLALLAKLGISAQSDKVRKDYQAGAATLERYISTGEISATAAPGILPHRLGISAFGGMNLGTLSSVLPWSGGVSLQYQYEGFTFSRGFRATSTLFGYAAAAGNRHLAGSGLLLGVGYAFTEGPLRPFIDAHGGMGIFAIKGKSESSTTLKFIAESAIGLEYRFSRAFMSIAPLFVYIPDTEAPLQCAGIRLGAGFAF
jgi:hypothetical protein